MNKIYFCYRHKTCMRKFVTRSVFVLVAFPIISDLAFRILQNVQQQTMPI